MSKTRRIEETADIVEETVDVVEVKAPKVISEREKLWKEYVANYKTKNPVKAAAKEANGEFDVPPISFLGKKEVRKNQNGTTSVVIY